METKVDKKRKKRERKKGPTVGSHYTLTSNTQETHGDNKKVIKEQVNELERKEGYQDTKGRKVPSDST